MGKKIAQELCNIIQQTSYWNGMKDRVKSKAVFETVDKRTGHRCLAMAPSVTPHNTFSLRTGETTYLVLAAHTLPKPGAELKAKTRATPGTLIVSFDFESQELQGLSIYSASYWKISGSTPFDYSNIVGNKKEKTDIHSLVATQASVSRDAGKGIVYGASYGGGVKAGTRTILSWHPDYSKDNAKDFALQVLSAYRGKKNYETDRYEGGTGSQAFNKMLDLLSVEEPQTPLLGTKMAPACWPANCGEHGSPSQSNWMVQSLGSGMLQASIVANWYYSDLLGIETSLAITMHDEEVYSTLARDARDFAYVQQISHCLTWSLFHHNLGIFDLPLNRIFMNCSIDKIWRKDPLKKVKTPTFEHSMLGEDYSFQRLVSEGYMNRVEKRYERAVDPIGA